MKNEKDGNFVISLLLAKNEAVHSDVIKELKKEEVNIK